MGRRPSGGMRIDRVRSRHTVASGETRYYESSLLRRSFRKPDGKVGKQTLAKLSTLAWWNDVSLGVDLGVAGAARNEVYAAMDWLVDRQDAIEAALASRHLREGGRAMFDLSSSWVEGHCCELAARGYSRDGKK